MPESVEEVDTGGVGSADGRIVVWAAWSFLTVVQLQTHVGQVRIEPVEPKWRKTITEAMESDGHLRVEGVATWSATPPHSAKRMRPKSITAWKNDPRAFFDLLASTEIQEIE